MVYSSGNPASETFDCLIVHENNSFSGALITVDNPEFIDRANGDYHLNYLTSPAVDYCNSKVTSPVYTDIDNQERGWDWPFINRDYTAMI